MDTRQLILQVAEQLFMQHGYASVSMSQIVEEISKTRSLTMPSIYYHFATKEALYGAVLLEVSERTGRMIAQAAEVQGAMRGRLHAVAGALGRAKPERFTRMLLDMNEHLQPETRQRVGEAFARLIFAPVVRVFADGIASGELRPDLDPSIAAGGLFALVSSFDGAEGSAFPVIAPEAAADLWLDGMWARP